MALYGSSVPIDGQPNGAMAVLVICPNGYSHQRLMQALQSIVPDAGEPPPQPDPAVTRALEAAVILRDPEQDDDEGEPFNRDFTACRVDGGCE